MRKLLSLLTVLTVTTPVPLNVIACGGGTKTPPVTDDTDYLTLAQIAKEKIQTEFANLVNNESNLRVEGDVTNGKTIMTYLNTTDQTQDTNITNKATIDGFLEVLNNQVAEISNKLVSNYPELKPLFNGINPNEILQINTNNLDTIFTSKTFDWKNNNFGLQDYDPDKYSINNWYYLNANLTLDFTCLDENAKITTSTINQSYDMYFANDGSNLRGVVSAATAQLETNLKDFIVEIDNTVDSDIDNSNISETKKLIKNQINNAKVTITNVKNDNITTLSNGGGYSTGNAMYDAYSKSTVDEASASLNNYLTSHVNTFITNLDNWIGTGSTAKQIKLKKDNICQFGTCTIDDWNISGLALKPIKLDFINARNDQTQSQWAEQTAKALGTIFCASGSFAQGRINLWNDSNLTMYINPSDFDNFVNKNAKLSDISEYISEKINKKAQAENIIKKNIATSLNGFWAKDPTLSDSKTVTKVDDKTFIINNGQNGMPITNYLIISYDRTEFLAGHIELQGGIRVAFNNWIIKKADQDVWPTT